MTHRDDKYARLWRERAATASPAQKLVETNSRYLHPYACFACRRSFKRAHFSAAVMPCPRCAGPAIGLTRKFKPPKHTDTGQWAKVEALVRAGFLFWSLPEPYPDTLKEVPAFVDRNRATVEKARKARPEAYAAVEAALAR